MRKKYVKNQSISFYVDVSEVVSPKLAAPAIDLLSVKPDKIQKLRKIAASCERIQSSKNDDIVISSVGSSPSSSPCPENFGSLSSPVDPVQLRA